MAVSHDLDSPPRMALRRAGDGEVARDLGGGEAPDLARFEISPPELLKIPTADGTELEAMMVRPHGFDPSRAHPAWVHVYGGPHAPQVRNAWPGTSGMWFQYPGAAGHRHPRRG